MVRLLAVLIVLTALWAGRGVVEVLQLDLNRPYSASAVFVDRNGRTLSRGWLHLSELPPEAAQLLIAREDERFPSRTGAIDWRAMARAAISRQGASTIPMQAARCAYQLPGGSYPSSLPGKLRRKLFEIILAERLCRRFTREQILELYLNSANFAGHQGLRAAAIANFGREPRDLPLEDMLWLYQTLPAPFPRSRHQRAPHLLHLVYEGLQRRGRLEPGVEIPRHPRILFARAETTAVYSGLPVSWQAEFARPLKPLASQMSAPIIQLSVDFRLQRALQGIVSDEVVRLAQTLPGTADQLDAALVVVENHTADVLAIIPGRDPSRSFSNSTEARRDVGSITKTFTLAACLESGRYSLSSIVNDTPIAKGELLAAPDYAPHDYDGDYLGEVPLIRAYALSANAAFERLGAECAGVDSLLASVALLQHQL